MKKLILFSLFALAAIFLVPELSEAANFLGNSSLTNLAGSGSLFTAGFGIAAQARALEAEAEERLSSFAGKGNNYDGDNYDGDNYIGMNDDGVDFNGNGKSFITELNSNLTFGFSIVNATAGRQVIAITPTFLGTAAKIAAYTGETVDGILADGTIKTSVTGASLQTKRKIEYLQNFVARNPTRVTEMTIQADNEAQLEEVITLAQLSPFRDLANNTLLLTNYVDPNQLTQKKAIVPLAIEFPEFQLDDQNVLLLPVTVGTVKVTFKIGAIKNPASELFRKGKKAYSNLRAKGLM